MSDLTCGKILNYSRIYGQKIPLEDVVQKIAQLDLSYIPYIAYLLAELYCPKSSIKSLYFRTKASQITHKFENLNSKGFISRQTISDNEKVKRFAVMSENPNLFITSTHGLLYLSKYFYAYSNQSKQFPITEYKNFDQNKLIEIIDLNLMLKISRFYNIGCFRLQIPPT